MYSVRFVDKLVGQREKNGFFGYFCAYGLCFEKDQMSRVAWRAEIRGSVAGFQVYFLSKVISKN